MASGRSGGTRGSERKSATFYGRATKGESATPPSRKKKKEGTRNRGEGRTERGREKEQSDRGALLPAGLARRRRRPCRAAARSVNVFSFFLALSLPSTLSLSLLSLPSCPPVPSTVSSRSLSLASSRIPLSFVAPPTRQRSRAASRTRDTGACEIPLSSCERTPVRGQDYPAPCAIAKNQFVAPRDTLTVAVVVVIVSSDRESRSEIRHRGSQR